MKRLLVVVALLIVPPTLSAQSAGRVPTLTPEEQRQIDAQLAEPRLVGEFAGLQLEGTAREMLDAIATTMGVKLTYDASVVTMDRKVKMTTTRSAVTDALRLVASSNNLELKALGPKSALIYANTPANREKFAESVKAFPIVKADPLRLVQLLSQQASASTDPIRPVFITMRSSPTIWVRATASRMAEIAKFIADNDK